MSRVFRYISFLVLIGLLYALLQVFNWDVLALLGWIWDKSWGVVQTVANFFSGNQTFQDITKHK